MWGRGIGPDAECRVMSDEAYKPLKASRTQRVQVRGADYLVRLWGPGSAPPLVLLHGARSTSATFQFLVDAFKMDWRVIAPDWRGHGHTHSLSSNGAWFHEYLADLDALLRAL